MPSNRNIVVIGGSAGAAPALTDLFHALPADIPAAIFVVVHLDPAGFNWPAARFADRSKLPVESLETTAPIREGRIYVARPDRHLIVEASSVTVSRGPRENLWRPAIDVLFRAAAVHHTSRVIGVIMSGQLDDGTAGLQAIKQCGGIAVVQDPADALFAEMPLTATMNVNIDYRVPASELASLLIRLINEPAGVAPEVPSALAEEVMIAHGMESFATLTEHRGTLTELSCPECSGPLWRRGEDEMQFRCLTGHSYRGESLLYGYDLELDRSLWAAVRLFEQRANISRLLERQERTQNRERRAEIHRAHAEETQRYASMLREVLTQLRGAD